MTFWCYRSIDHIAMLCDQVITEYRLRSKLKLCDQLIIVMRSSDHRIPLEDVIKHILIRGVGLSALGKLDEDTIKLAANLSTPHHEGAGGEEDFDSRESFQKHVRRVSNRLKRKR